MKRIGLMDCNNFFVSCERLFRPDLAKTPVAVLSSNDGCIVARSQEVKDLGIPMGMPYFQVKEMCEKEGIVLFSSNFTLYRDISSRVMSALKEEFDVVEVYSVDEAFFEVDESLTEEEIAIIRLKIIQKTGIPVSIGIAGTKTLAKYASTEAKKGNGVCILDTKQWKETTKSLPCGTIWGIGRKTTQSLSNHGITTVSELLSLDHAFVAKEYGVVGERLILELSGTAVYGVENVAEYYPETHTSTRSFGKSTTDFGVLESAVSSHVAHVARKLRECEQVATRLTVVARGSRFGDFSHRKSATTLDMPYPTNDTLVLTKQASIILKNMYNAEIPYKKAGVAVSGLLPRKYLSGSLFEHTQQDSGLNEVIDTLSKRFGKHAVRTGVSMRSNAWADKKQKISKQYTTKWSEIPFVKAV